MKILVTGGAGFIGSHLCEKLINKGNEVICLDNLYTGSEKNISHLNHNKLFSFVKHDIIHKFHFDVDQIYNLACPASPVHYQRDPIKTMNTSVLGIINVMNLANKLNAKVLHTSTSEVYGDPELSPQKESYWGNVNPIGVRSCYDEGKRCAETICIDNHKQLNTKVKIVRIFNTYGPKMDINDGRVVSNFIVQALRGEDITIYGDGSQTRSFQYVDDLIDGLTRMMDTDDSVTGPINLGNPGEFTILGFAKKIIEMTGSKSKIVYLPLPKDDPKQRKPDISLARKKLKGWFPKIEIDEGLELTIKYFENKIIKR